MPIKLCTRCKDTKDYDQFFNHKREKDGKQPWCKTCKYDHNKTRDKTNINKYMKVYRSTEKGKSLTLANNHSERAKKFRRSPEWKSYYRNYLREYRTVDHNKIAHRLRNLIYGALKSRGFRKNSKTYKLLGADFSTVENHLIRTAVKNYGKYFPKRPYEIDHIIPCASAKTEEELIKLQHYTNLQFLYRKDNRTKHTSLTWRIT